MSRYPKRETIKKAAIVEAKRYKPDIGVINLGCVRDSSLNALIERYGIGDDYRIDYEDQCYFRREFEKAIQNEL